ncbi:MAG TPA: bifunctional ornithine acetyltransferase/N-acetylglutamate synthase, partial [Nakamurella sp.]
MTTTAPRGFRAAGVTAGLKQSGKPDVALVVNDGPRFDAAGVFTANRVKAAPIRWCENLFRRGHSGKVAAGGSDTQLAAVILNSGGANACTGPEGYQDTVATAEHVGSVLSLPASRVAVASTGLIGVRL